MIDQPRDRGPNTTGPGRPEDPNRPRTTRSSGSGMPTTGFIVGGLVIALAILAFFIFGDTDSQQTAEINMPPEVENNVTTEPDTAPADNAATPSGTGDATGSATGTEPSATPPNTDTNTTD